MSDLQRALVELARSVERDFSGESEAVNHIIRGLTRYLKLRDEARAILAPLQAALMQMQSPPTPAPELVDDMPRVVANGARVN